VTLIEVNDAPLGADDALGAIAEDSGARTISFASLLANDSRGPANESGQTLTVTSVQNAVGGTVAIVGSDVLFTPSADFYGAASFDYVLQDNGTDNGSPNWLTSTAHVSFAVTPVADAVNDAVRTDPDTAIVIDVLANDTFEASPSITAISPAAHGTILLDDNGTPGDGTDDFVVYTPNLGFRGADNFTYTVTSGGVTETASVNVRMGVDIPTDFNADGSSDVLWQNNDGRAAIWLMDGINLVGGTVVPFNPGASWTTIGTGDFNTDGKADVLWQDGDGRVAIWLMDGANLIGGSVVPFNPESGRAARRARVLDGVYISVVGGA
jgi:hypothetical protein